MAKPSALRQVRIGDILPNPFRNLEDYPTIQTKVDEIKAGMKAGTFEVFTGPIKDSTGKERLAKGTAADDDWRGKIDFYVKGVEGKIPSGK